MREMPISSWQKLGAVLREARRDRGLTQQHLADRAGVSRAWLARFEKGHRRAEIEQVFRVLTALDLSMTLRSTQRTDGEATALAAMRTRQTINESD